MVRGRRRDRRIYARGASHPCAYGRVVVGYWRGRGWVRSSPNTVSSPPLAILSQRRPVPSLPPTPQADAAVKHHVLGEVPDDLAAALMDADIGAVQRDGLACRAVLQFLAVENLRDAAAFLAKFRSLIETESRYTVFCALVVETCQHDAGCQRTSVPT